MNNLLMLTLFFALVAIAAANSSQEENEQSLERVQREAGIRKSKKETRKTKNGDKKTKRMKKKKQRRNKKKGSRGKKVGKKSGSKRRGGKPAKNQKKRNKNKQRKNKQRKNKRKSGLGQVHGRVTACTANATCLDFAMNYLKIMKGQVNSFDKQLARIISVNKTRNNKFGKKGLFGPVLRRLVDAGGGNKSALSCQGSTNSSGAKQLTNLTETLTACEASINKTCNPATFSLPNMTLVNSCNSTVSSFKTLVDACLKLAGIEACGCWMNSELATLETTIKSSDCKLPDATRTLVNEVKICKSSFSNCRKFEDDTLTAISSCSKR